MPNWCFTSVTIHSTKENLDIIERELVNATSTNPVKADFGNTWLGNLLLYIGMDEDSVVHGDIRCRGSMEDFLRQDDETIDCVIYSAWSPHIQCICKFVDHYVDDAEIIYTAEEPGCELYWTNDPAVEDTVYIDSLIENEMPEEYMKILTFQGCNQRILIKYLNDLLNARASSLEELNVMLNKQLEEYDNYIGMHAYRYVDIGECD